MTTRRNFKKVYKHAPVKDIIQDYESADSMERYYQQRKIKTISNLFRKISEEGYLILDLGAGHGAILDLASNYLSKGCLIGLELSKDHCVTLREKGYNPIFCDVENIPIRNEVADTILFLDVIEHLHSSERALREIFRLLKGNGKLLLSTPNKFGIYEYKEIVYFGLRGVSDLLHARAFRGETRSYYPYHINLYGLKELLETVRKYNFHTKYVATAGFCLPLLGNVKLLAELLSVDIFKSNTLRAFIEMLEKRFPFFNSVIVLLCEKPMKKRNMKVIGKSDK